MTRCIIKTCPNQTEPGSNANGMCDPCYEALVNGHQGPALARIAALYVDHDDRHIGFVPDKFDVRRTDGSSRPGRKHAYCSYFVLDLMHDRYCVAALEAYANACEAEYPLLAVDLRALVAKRREAWGL